MESRPQELALLLKPLPYAAAIHKPVLNSEGKPVDYVLASVNRAFEQLTGMERGSLLGRRASEVYPQTAGWPVDWEAMFARVAEEGRSVAVDRYSSGDGGRLEVATFREEPGYYAVVLRDIAEGPDGQPEDGEARSARPGGAQACGPRACGSPGGEWPVWHGGARRRAAKHSILPSLYTVIVEQAEAGSYDELLGLVLRQLRRLTGAVMAAFSEYHPDRGSMTVRRIESDQKLVDMAISVGGKRLLNTETPVDREFYEEMTTDIVGYRESLTAASRGGVSEGISVALQRMVGLEYFVGLAHVAGGRLLGASMVAFRGDQPEPCRELLRAFAHVTAAALKRKWEVSGTGPTEPTES